MEDIETITQPAELTISLYPHQLKNIFRMERLEREKEVISKSSGDRIYKIKTKMGFLSDEPGYGKTLCVVGVIARDKMDWSGSMETSTITRTELPSFDRGTDVIQTTIEYKSQRVNKNLILVQKQLVSDWLKAFSYTKLKVYAIKSIRDLNASFTDYDVIIIVPKVFNDFMKTRTSLFWKRFIFDEPSSTKIPKLEGVNAGFTWFMTATPCSFISIYSRSKSDYARNICYYMNRNSFDIQKISIKNSLDYLKNSFDMPAPMYKTHYATSKLISHFSSFVSPQIIELISAGNIDAVIRKLGGQKCNNFIELLESQTSDEISFLNSKKVYYESRNMQDKVAEMEASINEQTKRRDEILKTAEKFREQNCSICYDVLVNPIVELNCKNLFCAKCMLTWLENQKTCPICRKVTPTSLTYITDSIDTEQKVSKEDLIVNIINQKPNGKFLLFSSENETFNKIKHTLLENQISYAELTGTIGSIDRKIEEYKGGKTKVMFLNSKFQGAGINLVETTDIIIYHRMNEPQMIQIIGRANRIGRTTPVNVHTLLYQGEESAIKE